MLLELRRPTRPMKRALVLFASFAFAAFPAACAAPPATPTPAVMDTETAVAPLAPTATDPQAGIPSLYGTFADDFLVGAAVEPEQLGSKRHAALLERHFNSITAENAMKPGKLGPSEGNYYWTSADKLVKFAAENNLAVHGHTLVWHNQTTGWMFVDAERETLKPTPENKQLVLRRLETFIRAVVGRYKDAVNVWDVVNEVIDPAQPDCMRRSPYYELTGTEYIALAFRVAHEEAPGATLILNDYDTTDPVKSECICRVVRSLLDQGVPIDGIGHQMHVNITVPTADEIEATILKFAELGLEQHITEMDVSLYTNGTDKYDAIPEALLIRQGYRYKEIFEVYRRQAKFIQSVTFWGMADDHTWLTTFPIPRNDLPLLFDDHLNPKPAFWGIVDPSKLPAQT